MFSSFLKPITASSSFGCFCAKRYHFPKEIRLQRLNFATEIGWTRSVSHVSGRRNRISVMGFCGVSDEGTSASEQESMVRERSLGPDGGWIEATLNGLSKWFISGLFAVIIVLRHDPEALWASMGAILNALLSVQLKKIINQDRPFPTSRPDPGMPSSHAQAIFFAVAFVNLSLIEWLGMNALTTTIGGFSFIIGCYFSWLRVSQRLHTVSQVTVGAVIGFVFALLWFWSWDAFVLNCFISSVWVRVLVILSALGFCAGFVVHVWRKWLLDER